MPSSNQAEALRSLLLIPGIHRGTVVRPRVRRITTAVASVDRMLDGGLPEGAITEVVGHRSTGKTSFVHAVVAAISARGAFTAYIDLADVFDAEHASAAGVRLDRMLWVRPPTVRAAVRAAEYVVDTGGFSLVVIDLDDVHDGLDRAVTSAWVRLARAVATRPIVVITLGSRRNVGIAASVSLELGKRTASFSGGGGPLPLFDGIASTIECRKNKLGPGSVPATQFTAPA